MFGIIDKVFKDAHGRPTATISALIAHLNIK
jgi:hypothetical protein